MTIVQLNYFIAVCDHGSLNMAAKKLFVTQPSLTSAINLLEKEFNLKLFHRSKGGLTLTNEGSYFYERAKLLIESVTNFKKDLEDLSKEKYTVRIGVPPMIGSFLFPKIHSGFIKEHPDANFEIWEEGSLKIRKMIQNKELDVGFSILNEAGQENYNREVLLETELYFCVSKDSPIAKRKVLTVNDIIDQPVILMREGYYQNQLITSMFADSQKKLNIILVSSQLSVILNFVKANAGGAFLMKELIDPRDDSLVGIPLSSPLKLSVGLIWQKDTMLHKGAIEFLNYFKNLKNNRNI